MRKYLFYIVLLAILFIPLAAYAEPCDPLPVPTDLYNSFESPADLDCWTITTVDEGDNRGYSVTHNNWILSSDGGNTGSSCLKKPRSSYGSTSLLVSRPITVDRANKYIVSYYIYRKRNTEAGEGVELMFNNIPDTAGAVGTQFIPVAMNRSPYVVREGWYRYDFRIPIAGTVYVMVKGVSQYYDVILLDDIMVEPVPPCYEVYDLAISDYANDVVSASWQANTGESDWLMAYSLSGNDTVVADTVALTESSYVFDQLKKKEQYTLSVSVAALCSPIDTSAWTTVTKTFTATCDEVRGYMKDTICSNQVYHFGNLELNTPGTYQQPIPMSNGCDSIVTLDLTVLDTKSSEIYDTICSNETYYFGNRYVSGQGDYQHTVTASNGCDSLITLHLYELPISETELYDTICSNETYYFCGDYLTEEGDYDCTLTAANGCDSIIYLSLSILPTYELEIYDTICEGDSYYFCDDYLTEEGDYDCTVPAANGCDSTTYLSLTVLTKDVVNIDAAICEGDSYPFAGKELTKAGLYSDTLRYKWGCDSVITNLTLTVNPVYNHDVYETICSGHSYSFGPYTFTESVTETHTFASKAGCDSTVTLHLTVTPPIVGEEKATICQGEVYLFNGIGHTEANTYSYPLKTAEGCDSIARLILTVKPIYPDVRDTVEICQGESHSFGPYLLTVAGDYTYTFPANDCRCDSTVSLHLVVNPVYNHEVYETVCSGNSFPFGGENFSVTGVYTHRFTSKAGCDSTVTLHLTVTPAIVGITTAAICDGEEYEFNGTKYSVAGTYDYKTKTAEGCDSIARLVLTVNPIYNEEIHETICSGKSFLFGGEECTESGDYTHVFKSKAGCDSIVTLHLTVTPPNVGIVKATICDNESYPFNGTAYTEAGTYDYKTKTAEGCDSTARLVLTVNPTYNEEIHETICSGKSFLFGGVERTEAGDYIYVFKSKDGCDSIVTLHLTVNPVYNEEISAAICEGESYLFGGLNRTKSGVYTHTFTSKEGCDSTVTLHLTVHPTYIIEQNAIICSGKSFLFGGEERTESGDYTHVFKSKAGCDSTVTLHLTVTPPNVGIVKATICDNGSYPFNGTDYTEAGTYDYKTKTAEGCDSIARLVLTVNPTYNEEIHETICSGKSFLFGGVERTEAGDYTHVFKSKDGCDSIVTLHLTVNPVYNEEVSAAICPGKSFLFGGVERTEAGDYTHTFTSKDGCDSIVTLHLTHNPVYNEEISVTVCSGKAYLFAGINRTESGDYTHTFTSKEGCDSTVTLHLTVTPPVVGVVYASISQGSSYPFNGTDYTRAGTYDYKTKTAEGCDSIARLVLTVNSGYTLEIFETICSGNSFLFGGVERIATGDYTHTFKSTLGTDSTVTLHLTVTPPIVGEEKATICQGEVYLFNGIGHTEANTYSYPLKTAEGCDSIARLILTVKPIYPDVRDTVEICQGESHSFGSYNLTVADDYTYTFPANNYRCDSTVNLHLVVNPVYNHEVYETICSGKAFSFGGVNCTESGVYTHKFTSRSGCDSTVTLHLTVTEPRVGIVNATICLGESYSFNGVNYTNANTYSHNLKTADGCDSIAQLVLTVNPVYMGERYATVCSGGTYTFGGIVYTASGDYTHVFKSKAGCDSTVTLHLTVTTPNVGVVNAAICDNESYPFNGTDYTEAGTYDYKTKTAEGCDSIARLVLTVNPTYNVDTSVTICSDTPYLFGGANLTLTGDYTHTFITKAGCDSTVNLHLVVNPVYNHDVYETVCSGKSYLFAGINRTESGDYTHIFKTKAGCDSTVTLHLTVTPPVVGVVNATICKGEEYEFNGTRYTVAGTYDYKTQTHEGCDSIARLVLTVNPAYNEEIYETICSGKSYPFAGVNRTASGDYTYAFTTKDGCDSTVTLHLTVAPPSVGVVDASICNGDVYPFNGLDYAETGTYNHLLKTAEGCDSIATLNLTVNPVYNVETYEAVCSGETLAFKTMAGADTVLNTSGTYKGVYVVDGCDSTVTLHLTVKPVYNETVSVTVCQGNSYVFGSNVLTEGGIYTHTFPENEYRCDSTVTLRLSMTMPNVGIVRDSICSGDSVLFNGQYYKEEGVHNVTLKTVEGCDSIARLILTLNPLYDVTVYDTICEGDSVLFNDRYYKTSGIFRRNLNSVHGCDSVARLNLTVKRRYTDVKDTIKICQGEGYNFGSMVLTESDDYTYTFPENKYRCDSTVNLHLVVNPVYNIDVYETVCSGKAFLFAGINRTESGDYTHKFASEAGCDSTVTLHLTVTPPVVGVVDATICQGEEYEFNGVKYTATGTYDYKTKTAEGCDSIARLGLTVNPAYNIDTAVAICSGTVYPFGDAILNETGDYTHVFKTKAGCDSTVTLHLTVTPPVVGVVDATICQGEEYEFNGIKYTATGTYDYETKTAEGCDSIARLVLVVNPSYNYTIYKRICYDESVVFKTNEGVDTVLNTSGEYIGAYQTVNGCDSVVTLRLTVIEQKVNQIAATICEGDSVLHNGVYYAEAGIYEYTTETADGCDMVVRFTVAVNSVDTTHLYGSVCSGLNYEFLGNRYSKSGDYVHNLSSTKTGCDSTVILHLTVTPPVESVISDAICAGDTASFLGVEYTQAGEYRHKFTTAEGCDSIVVFSLAVNPVYTVDDVLMIHYGESYQFGSQTITMPGLYTETFESIHGCDSTVNLYVDTVPANMGVVYRTICPDDTCEFHGEIYMIDGIYDHRFRTDDGRDTIARLILSVAPVYNVTESVVICEGETYSFGGNSLVASGVYVETLTSSYGCDSIVTLHLTVNPIDSVDVYATICSGGNYEFGGYVYSIGGDYAHTFVNSNGCDSVVTLHLDILPPVEGDVTYYTICEGDTVVFHGVEYYRGGKYSRTLKASDGCDSIAVLSLAVNPVDTVSDMILLNEGKSYQFGGQTITAAGDYTEIFVSSIGCDSVVNLHVEIIPENAGVLNDTICAGTDYDFYGIIYTSGGRYEHSYTTADGRDTVVILMLEEYPVYNNTDSAIICDGDVYPFGDNLLVDGGVYVDTLSSRYGCDSIVTLKLTVIPAIRVDTLLSVCTNTGYEFGDSILYESGKYIHTFQSVSGCDSTVTLYLTVLPVAGSEISATVCSGKGFELGDTVYYTAGEHKHTFAAVNGCDSVVTLHLTVTPPVVTYETVYDAFIMYDGPGEYDYTVTDTLKTVEGCDSVVVFRYIHLEKPGVRDIYETPCEGSQYTLNGKIYTEPGVYTDTMTVYDEGDLIVNIYLTFNPVYNNTVEASLCPGESIFFGDRYYKESGAYTYYGKTAEGCDSIVTLNLVVGEYIVGNIYANICAGSSYDFAGQSLTEPGIYADTVSMVDGCDSIVRLHLNVMPAITSKTTVAIREGESYLFGDTILTTEGLYFNTFPTSEGCDSIVELTLMVLNKSGVDTISQTLCFGGSFEFDGVIYDTTGVYSYASIVGEDTIVTVINIEVLPEIVVEIDTTVCYGSLFYLDGQEIYESGVYSTALSAANGCDSVVVYNLTITPENRSVIIDTICGGDTLVFGSQTISVSGVYTETFVSSSGCDSIVTFELVVLPSYEQEIYDTICEGDVYELGSNLITSAGVYTDTLLTADGCDSIVTLTLNVLPVAVFDTTISVYQGFSATFNDTVVYDEGEYTWTYVAANGCDSIVNLNFTFSFRMQEEYKEIIIAPNPIDVEGITYVFANFTQEEIDGMLITIYNAAGEMVLLDKAPDFPYMISGIHVSGIYYVRFVTSDGRRFAAKLMVK